MQIAPASDNLFRLPTTVFFPLPPVLKRPTAMGLATSERLRDAAIAADNGAPLAPGLSIVMPCLNEAETLAACNSEAKRAFHEDAIDGEVVAADRCGKVEVEGYEVSPRRYTAIPVHQFDGRTLPVADQSADIVLLVEALHQTEDPMILLKEAKPASWIFESGLHFLAKLSPDQSAAPRLKAALPIPPT
jgi:hypothetical protein